MAFIIRSGIAKPTDAGSLAHAKRLQTALGALLGRSLAVDGDIGPATMGAIEAAGRLLGDDRLTFAALPTTDAQVLELAAIVEAGILSRAGTPPPGSGKDVPPAESPTPAPKGKLPTSGGPTPSAPTKPSGMATAVVALVILGLLVATA